MAHNIYAVIDPDPASVNVAVAPPPTSSPAEPRVARLRGGSSRVFTVLSPARGSSRVITALSLLSAVTSCCQNFCDALTLDFVPFPIHPRCRFSSFLVHLFETAVGADAAF